MRTSGAETQQSQDPHTWVGDLAAPPTSVPVVVSSTTMEGPMQPSKGVTLEHISGDQRGVCCWAPQDVSYKSPVLQDWEM